jgi:hypothetical protein
MKYLPPKATLVAFPAVRFGSYAERFQSKRLWRYRRPITDGDRLFGSRPLSPKTLAENSISLLVLVK